MSRCQKVGGVPCFYRLFLSLLVLLFLNACGGGSSPIVAGSDNQDTTQDTQDNSDAQDNVSDTEDNTSIQDNSDTQTPPDPIDNPDDVTTQTATRILPLGDSVTQGGDGFASYRRALWFKLKNAGYKVDFIGSHSGFEGDIDNNLKDFDLDHEGHWAWETNQLEENLTEWINAYSPDIVLLHTGTNDVDRGHSHSSTIDEIDGIIRTLRDKNPKVIILLAKIIPMKNTDTAEFNHFVGAFAASETSQNSPIIIVDHYSGYDPQSDSHDNYHPNSNGEEKMATQWFNALQPYL